jgi:hypothetical protein
MTYDICVSIFYWIDVNFHQFYKKILDEGSIFVFSHKQEILYRYELKSMCDKNKVILRVFNLCLV